MSEQDPVRTTLDVPGAPDRTTPDPGARVEPRSTTNYQDRKSVV